MCWRGGVGWYLRQFRKLSGLLKWSANYWRPRFSSPSEVLFFSSLCLWTPVVTSLCTFVSPCYVCTASAGSFQSPFYSSSLYRSWWRRWLFFRSVSQRMCPNKNRQTSTRIRKQINKQAAKTNKQTNKQANEQTRNHVNKDPNKQADRQTDRQIRKQINKQTDKQTNKLTEASKQIIRQTNKQARK